MSMGFIDAFRRDRTLVITECRRCGTSVDGESSTCPVCATDEIATYAIE